MLTPAFDLSQDDYTVTVCIKVPYAMASEKYVYYDEHDFTFFCKPYYLRLKLPGPVIFEEEPTIVYDVIQGTMTVKMVKVNPEEYFEGLDLLTQLLAPKVKSSSPTIEVLGDANGGEDDDKEWEEFDWFAEQVPDERTILFMGKPYCGFGDLHSSSVFKLKEEASEIFDIVEPETKTSFQLHEERLHAESKQFSYEHYLADLYQDEEIQQIITFSPEWNDLCKKVASSSSHDPDEIIHFTSEEKERLRALPNKEYLLNKAESQTLYYGLIDIIFAYAYDRRTTLGEPTVESAWTINKLSSTLSWLEKFTSLEPVIRSSVRRSLCYPLYRHWGLAISVLEDTRKIFSLGRKYVLKCLLDIHRLFSGSDPRYILNDLFISDYCVWIQSRRCKTKVFTTLADALGKIKVTKEDMDLELIEFEQGAELAIQEQNLCIVSSVACQSSSTDGSSSAGNSDSQSRSPLLQEKCVTDSVSSKFQSLSVSDGTNHAAESSLCQSCSSTSSGSAPAKFDCHNEENIQPSSHVIIHVPSLDPTVPDSDDSSDSESSTDSCSDTLTETDSDDESSTSSDSYSDDSDADSTFSNNSNEHSRLLKKEKSYERRR